VPRVVSALKNNFPELGVITDVALDPYTTHGQDGLIDKSGYVLNDETIAVLQKQALVNAADRSGISSRLPDMMDGRIGAIRSALDADGHVHTRILAYSAKYAFRILWSISRCSWIFRTARQEHKYNYQMDFANSDEALWEAGLDLAEGADMVMIKPGMPYHRYHSPYQR
jgi:porphobilinogen synthase